MLTSKGLVFYRLFNTVKNRNLWNTNKIPICRNSSGGAYRVGADIRPRLHLYGDIVGGIMFWWILWHLWHEHEHITGEFDYPDPSQWTNAELGIPPDSFEE